MAEDYPRQVFAEYNLWGPPAERQPGPLGSSNFNVGPKHPQPPIQDLPPKPMGPRPQKPEDLDKRVIFKELLFADCGDSEDDPEPAELSRDPETRNYRWESRSARVNNRGRNSNLMHRSLIRPLSKPVRMERGAEMHSPGWNSGGLGRIPDIVEPNASYGMDAGFGHYSPMVSPPLMSSPPPLHPMALSPPALYHGRNSRSYRFRTNFLKLILEFVEDDKCIELFFDKLLMNREKKKIHEMVSCLEKGEMTCMLDTKQKQILSEIQSRKRYQLRTCHNYEGDEREICLFKQASADIYVVIADDVRPCNTEIRRAEEEVNPFLKSINKHIREECGDILKPKVPYLLDKLIENFLEFSDVDQYQEFRFLGPFTGEEMYVIDKFINIIQALTNQRVPGFEVPVELLNAFTKTHHFQIDKSSGGFVTIKKVHCDLRMEVNQQEEERWRRVW